MKIIKRLLLLLILSVLSFTLISCGDKKQQDTSTEEGAEFVYKINESGEASIIRYRGKSAQIIIPEQIDGYPVTSIGESAFFNNTKITEVTLPSGITLIGKSAFEGCSTLRKINLPSSVEKIGDKGFYNCICLEELAIESGSALKEIGDNALSGCRSLKGEEYGNAKYLSTGDSPYDILLSAKDTSITTAEIHTDTRIINGGAFDRCASLTSITIPENIEFIGNSAFYGCTKLETIFFNAVSMGDLTPSANLFARVATTSETMTLYVGSSVKRIPANLMNGTSRLRVLRFIDGSVCESIGEGAFANTPLPEVTIPASVKVIEPLAFANCDWLKTIKLDSIQLNDLDDNNRIFEGSCDKVTDVTLTIGRNVVHVPSYFCESMHRLNYVKFENNEVTKSFGEGAFFGCQTILKVDITSRKAWCESSFANEYSNPLRYGNAVLYVNNKSVTEGFALTENIDYIADYAFTGYKKLEKIIIPKTVTYIGKNAFDGVENLNHIYWCGNEAEWRALSIQSGNSIINSSIIYYYRDYELGNPTTPGNFWYLNDEGTPNVWRNVITN